MAITQLNIIPDFESGIKCLQNPSLISKLSPLNKITPSYSFLTLGALLLTIFATFTTLFNKINNIIHQIRLKVSFSCQNSHTNQIFDEDDFDFDFSDDDDTPSSVAESDDEEMDSNDGRVGDVFRADGDLSLRRRNGFSWSDFSAGKSVVQLWDSFGLGLGFEEDETEYGSGIEIWDLDRQVKISSGKRRQVAVATENVVLTAEMDCGNGGVGFGTYDSRVDDESPAVYAAWRPRRRKF